MFSGFKKIYLKSIGEIPEKSWNIYKLKNTLLNNPEELSREFFLKKKHILNWMNKNSTTYQNSEDSQSNADQRNANEDHNKVPFCTHLIGQE